MLQLHAAPLTAATFGFVTGLIANYTYHTLVTFKSTFSPGALIRFMTVALLNYLVTLASVSIAVPFLHITSIVSALVGKIVALPLVAFNTFMLSKCQDYT